MGTKSSGAGAVTSLVLVAVVLLAAGVAATPADGQSETDTVTLTVSVTDRAGDPVGDASVIATWTGDDARRTTAGNGKAFIDVPAGREVILTVDHPDYVRNSPRNVTRRSDGEVVLDVAERSELTLVTANTEGERVDGAAVTLKRDGRTVDRGRTDADGQYVSRTIQAGRYTLRVTKPRYYNRTAEIMIDGPTTHPVTVERGSVQYEFRVVDGHFDPSRPVPDATVEVGSLATLRTLDDGRATLGVPVNTVQRVEVSKDGYRTVTERVHVGESAGDRSLGVRRSAALNVTADAERVVVGERVTVRVHNAYGEPVGGATLLRNGSTVGETAEDGTFAVPIQGQRAEIRARADGVRSGTLVIEGVAIDDGATVTPADAPPIVPAPGFGAVVSLVALAALGALLVRRRRR
jgi:hypothetical protein